MAKIENVRHVLNGSSFRASRFTDRKKQRMGKGVWRKNLKTRSRLAFRGS